MGNEFVSRILNLVSELTTIQVLFAFQSVMGKMQLSLHITFFFLPHVRESLNHAFSRLTYRGVVIIRNR